MGQVWCGTVWVRCDAVQCGLGLVKRGTVWYSVGHVVWYSVVQVLHCVVWYRVVGYRCGVVQVWYSMMWYGRGVLQTC